MTTVLNIYHDVIHIICLAFFGILSRQAITHLTHTTLKLLPSPLFSSFFSNVLGCSLMGLVVRSQEHIYKHTNSSVYLAVTSGYCGCFTTFSGWIFTAVHEFARWNVGYGFMTLLLGLCVSVSSFIVGCHIYEALNKHWRKEYRGNSRSPNKSDVVYAYDLSSFNNSDPKWDATLIKSKSSQNERMHNDQQTQQVRPDEGEQFMFGIKRNFSDPIHQFSKNIRRPIDTATTPSHTRKSHPPRRSDSFIQSFLLTVPTVEVSSPDSHSPTCFDTHLQLSKSAMSKVTTADNKDHQIKLITNTLMTILVIVMYTSLSIGYIYDKDQFRIETYWSPGLFGPLGAIARFLLSKLNTKSPFLLRFPLGTFLANILSVILISIINGFLVSSEGIDPRISSGLTSGLCGSLSTVSSFIGELHLLSLPYAYLYGTLIC